MSYTFLPYPEQQKIRKEYRNRVVIVLFFFVSISLVIGVGSLFPAYISAALSERLHLDQVAAFKKTTDALAIATTQKQLAFSQTVLDAVSNTIQPDLFSSAISSIVAIRGNVKLNSFTVEHSSASVTTIVVNGIAATRQDLLDLKDRIQKSPGTVSVDLPVSILAQDRNISFSIQITETF